MLKKAPDVPYQGLRPRAQERVDFDCDWEDQVLRHHLGVPHHEISFRLRLFAKATTQSTSGSEQCLNTPLKRWKTALAAEQNDLFANISLGSALWLRKT